MAAPASFDLPCEIDPALAGDQGNTPYNSRDQLQVDTANAEAHTGPRLGPRMQTGASTYGGYSSDLSDVVSNASEKLLEVNAHFIRARMIVDERAAEIERLQELLARQTKEKNDLKVEVRTLKEALRLFAKDYHSNKHANGHRFSNTTSEKALTVESEPTTQQSLRGTQSEAPQSRRQSD
ncbi:hypothetical protein EDB84DRAFT_1488104 [Lactarius hengduanensis]|nr:hypothetical protein EDB84DRAFT_1488104 [Lactarius hengduanensis]